MRKLYYIVQKEFLQIIRNKAILPLMTIVPIIQLILLSFAATNEVKNVELAIVDPSPSVFTRQLVHKISVSEQFILSEILSSMRIADEQMQRGDIDIVLNIPPLFEKTLIKEKTAKIQLIVNAINGQQATVGATYLASIIQSFNQELRVELLPQIVYKKQQVIPQMKLNHSYWYNPELDFKYFMVPGILGQLVTILVILLTAMNIVREREIGTIEQINVTPIKKWQFILGKLIPFLLVGIILLTVGLTAGKIIFDVPIRGSLFVVFTYCFVNLTAVLGLGLLISNISNTQQQAMLSTFFFVIVFVLMSGLFTPIESMPKLAQYFTIPNPLAHFVHVMRSVLLKGSGFTDVLYNFQVTAILAVVFNGLAIWTYRKVS